MVKTGQAWSGTIVTLDATGALAAASVGPAGVLYVDGTANGASVTVTGSNPYKWAVTLPALTAGQTVSMYITATVGGITTGAVVAEDIADTKRVSDLNDSAYAGGAVASVTGDVAGKVLGGGVSSITGTGVRAVDASGDALATAATAAAILEDTGTTLPAAIADVPTVAEFEARTLPAANYFDPAADTVVNVTNVATVNALATDAVSAAALAAGAVDEILDEVVEGSITLRQAIRIILARLVNKASGGNTTTLTFRDVADSKPRVTMTVDADGNRSAVTLDGA